MLIRECVASNKQSYIAERVVFPIYNWASMFNMCFYEHWGAQRSKKTVGCNGSIFVAKLSSSQCSAFVALRRHLIEWWIFSGQLHGRCIPYQPPSSQPTSRQIPVSLCSTLTPLSITCVSSLNRICDFSDNWALSFGAGQIGCYGTAPEVRVPSNGNQAKVEGLQG